MFNSIHNTVRIERHIFVPSNSVTVAANSLGLWNNEQHKSSNKHAEHLAGKCGWISSRLPSDMRRRESRERQKMSGCGVRSAPVELWENPMYFLPNSYL